MRVAIAYNESGSRVAALIKSLLLQLGHHAIDFGDSSPAADHADLTYRVGQAVLAHHADKAILICSSGFSTCIAANKIKGLYAAPCYDRFEAHVSRSRYNTNVLCLSARWMDSQDAQKIVREWLETPFEKRPADLRALKKIKTIEDEQLS